MNRVFYDVTVFLSIFLLPWWVTAILCLIGIFLFKNFYEFIFAFMLTYSVYGVGQSGFLSSKLYLPAILIVTYTILFIFKNQIIFYKK